MAQPVKYNDDFRHFDTLIWQVPAVASAVFLGTLFALNEIVKESCNENLPAETLCKPPTMVGGVPLLSTSLLATSLTLLMFGFVLYRFRVSQTWVFDESESSRPVPMLFGAQFVLQWYVFTLAGISSSLLFSAEIFALSSLEMAGWSLGFGFLLSCAAKAGLYCHKCEVKAHSQKPLDEKTKRHTSRLECMGKWIRSKMKLE